MPLKVKWNQKHVLVTIWEDHSIVAMELKSIVVKMFAFKIPKTLTIIIWTK